MRNCLVLSDNVIYLVISNHQIFEHIKDEIKNDFKFTNEVDSLCNEI